jgi:hypothetical protein
MSKRIAIVAAVVFGIFSIGSIGVENVNADDEASQHYKIDDLKVRVNE